MTPVETVQGDSPVILGLPHSGTHVPNEIWSNLNARGQGLDDTDWHIEKLYFGLLTGATTVRATFHRYVIDANRDPEGASLYPGQNTTGLVPLTDFDGQDIWATTPNAADVERRRVAYHAPYHAALEAEMIRVQARHGFAILFDCHSIRSHIPFLFDGALPDFNIGTNGTATCAQGIEDMVSGICANADGYTSIVNGRFKGGWSTRHYGRPERNWHAIQLELAQSTYLAQDAAPWMYDPDKAARLRHHLAKILNALAAVAPHPGSKT